MAVNLIKEPAPKPGKLKTADLYAIAVGQVIGAGVITLVVPALRMTGYSAWLAYLVAIFVGFLFVAPTIFVCSALRFGGGAYSVACDMMGPRIGGIFAYSYLAGPLYMSSFLLAAVEYVGDIVPALSSHGAKVVVALVLSTLFLIFNLRGMNIMAKAQKFMVWLLIAALLMFTVFGIVNFKYPIFDFSDPNFLPNGMIKFDNGLLTGGFLTAVFLFYNSVTGYYMTQGYGRDAENARRDIPKAILLTLPTLVVLYMGVAIAAIGSTSAAEFGESSSLVFAAKNIMPPALFYVFIIGGPMMALLSSLNSSYAYHSITIGQSCKDGWFPEKLATQNKHGAYTYILVFIYLISIVPIVIGFNITQLVNLLQLVTFMTSVIPQIAYLRLPKKYPEAWKNAKLHIPDGLYYLLCVVSIAICVIVFVKSCLSMSRTVVIVSTIGIVLCVVLGLWRSGKGNVTIRTSVWDESEEG